MHILHLNIDVLTAITITDKKHNLIFIQPQNTKETLINCLRGMKRKAHGAQEPRHIWKYVEVTSTAQRGDSPAQAINQRFPKLLLN